MHASWTKPTAIGQAGTAHFPFGADSPQAAPVWANATSSRTKLRTKSPELLRNVFGLQKETEQTQAMKAVRCGRQPASSPTAAAIQTVTSAAGPQVSGSTRR